ncbi:PREDICTED: uncharacterized protein LOC104816471 [Tarenaya hassleriana]|uniref:uncharacterized protein LOC104816471 n=1 Tax=Tarenaya hassleriana TaxID=28532 RepID=UPI00053CA470|nr:PREDICTED: uncharacterized protein LOC104816471 [Tarenaya hassleriana]
MEKLVRRGIRRHHDLLPAVSSSPFRVREESLPRFSSSPHHLPRACLVPEKISATTAMEKHHQSPSGEAEAVDHARECQGKEACEFHANKRFSDRIMPHILNLYGSCATARDFEIYARNASFEDPLIHAQGVKQIKSAFYSIPKVFKESRMVEYSIQENEIAPGKKEILIDNKQQYKFLGKNIDMISLIKLYVEDGKIVRHEDWWDKKPLRNKDTVSIPFVGRMLEVVRRGSMLATHAMMGFGKDPDSHQS